MFQPILEIPKSGPAIPYRYCIPHSHIHTLPKLKSWGRRCKPETLAPKKTLRGKLQKKIRRKVTLVMGNKG